MGEAVPVVAGILVPEAEGPALAALYGVPPFACVDSCRRVEEYTGYTWTSPTDFNGTTGSVQRNGCELCHFCRVHGFFQLA